MARFFFDFQDGKLIEDAAGVELADNALAYDHAVGLAEGFLRSRAERGRTDPWHVVIKDANGQLLGMVTSILF